MGNSSYKVNDASMIQNPQLLDFKFLICSWRVIHYTRSKPISSYYC